MNFLSEMRSLFIFCIRIRILLTLNYSQPQNLEQKSSQSLNNEGWGVKIVQRFTNFIRPIFCHNLEQVRIMIRFDGRYIIPVIIHCSLQPIVSGNQGAHGIRIFHTVTTYTPVYIVLGIFLVYRYSFLLYTAWSIRHILILRYSGVPKRYNVREHTYMEPIKII